MTSKVRRDEYQYGPRWAAERTENRATPGYPGTPLPEHDEKSGPDWTEIDDSQQGYRGPTADESVQSRVSNHKLSAFTKRVLELTDHKERSQPAGESVQQQDAAIDTVQRPNQDWKRYNVEHAQQMEDDKIRQPIKQVITAGSQKAGEYGRQHQASPETKDLVNRAIDRVAKFVDPKAMASTPRTGVTSRDVPIEMNMLEAGNIPTNNRPKIYNPDGSVSTVRTMGFTEDGRTINVPTAYAGRIHSDQEAIQRYRNTGEHLGVYDNILEANAAAQTLHEEQALGDSPVKVQPGYSYGDRKAAIGTYDRAYSKQDEAQRMAQHGSARAREAYGPLGNDFIDAVRSFTLPEKHRSAGNIPEEGRAPRIPEVTAARSFEKTSSPRVEKLPGGGSVTTTHSQEYGSGKYKYLGDGNYEVTRLGMGGSKK